MYIIIIIIVSFSTPDLCTKLQYTASYPGCPKPSGPLETPPARTDIQTAWQKFYN